MTPSDEVLCGMILLVFNYHSKSWCSVYVGGPGVYLHTYPRHHIQRSERLSSIPHWLHLRILEEYPRFLVDILVLLDLPLQWIPNQIPTHTQASHQNAMSLDPLQRIFDPAQTTSPMPQPPLEGDKLENLEPYCTAKCCSRSIWWLFWWYYYTEWLQVQEGIGSIDYERWQGTWNAVMLHLNTASNLWKLPHRFSYRLGTELGRQLAAYALTPSPPWPSMVNCLDIWLHLYCMGLNIYVQGHIQGFKILHKPVIITYIILTFCSAWEYTVAIVSTIQTLNTYLWSPCLQCCHTTLGGLPGPPQRNHQGNISPAPLEKWNTASPPVHIYHDRQTST